MRRSRTRISRSQRSCSRAAAGKQQRLDLPRPVDDPRQPAGADIQECADAGEQEDRCDGQLDDLRDGDDGCRGCRKHRVFYARKPRLAEVVKSTVPH